MANKVYHSDPSKDRIVCEKTYNMFRTLSRLGLTFGIPIREVLQPASFGGLMLDKFFKAYVRMDNNDK